MASIKDAQHKTKAPNRVPFRFGCGDELCAPRPRVIPTSVARWEFHTAAAGGRKRRCEISVAVEEIERPWSEDFFGNRKAGCDRTHFVEDAFQIPPPQPQNPRTCSENFSVFSLSIPTRKFLEVISNSEKVLNRENIYKMY